MCSFCCGLGVCSAHFCCREQNHSLFRYRLTISTAFRKRGDWSRIESGGSGSVAADVYLPQQLPGVSGYRCHRAAEELQILDFLYVKLVVTVGHLIPFIPGQYFMQQLQTIAAIAAFAGFIIAFFAVKRTAAGAGTDQRPSDPGKKFFCSPAVSSSAERTTRKTSLTMSGGASL